MWAHANQVRKYRGEPYFIHCAEVAALVAKAGAYDYVIAAAWLHDVLEDCPHVDEARLKNDFGKDITTLVVQMTDVASEGNRAARKAYDRQRWVGAHPAAMTIKLADLISNTRSIMPDDPHFGVVYLKEKCLLLPYLKQGSPMLYRIAEELVCQHS